ncbi:DNA polymerase delta catalytic subunit [Striga asiatica]|uniref:DNA polymerase delta catalytic subunit n=1 Tax=Striga asiatica TaxID=4170 RepID=A0A5A7Q189_STRAF|nr:DNA polymerase delta catalytic subunit [Striga asiatica]
MNLPVVCGIPDHRHDIHGQLLLISIDSKQRQPLPGVNNKGMNQRKLLTLSLSPFLLSEHIVFSDLTRVIKGPVFLIMCWIRDSSSRSPYLRLFAYLYPCMKPLQAKSKGYESTGGVFNTWSSTSPVIRRAARKQGFYTYVISLAAVYRAFSQSTSPHIDIKERSSVTRARVGGQQLL